MAEDFLIADRSRGRNRVRLQPIAYRSYGQGDENPVPWMECPFGDLGNGVVSTVPSINAGGVLTYARAGLASTRLSNGYWKLDVPADTPRSYYTASGIYLGYKPENATANRFLGTELLNNSAYWPAQPGAIAKDRTGPDGVANSAWTLTDNSAADFGILGQAVGSVNGQPLTWAVRVAKTVGAQATYPVMFMQVAAFCAVVTIDTTNGVATLWTAYTGFTILTGTSVVCKEFAPGWWTVELTKADSGGLTFNQQFCPAATANPTQSTGMFDAALTGSCGFAWPQCEDTPEATTYVVSGASAGTRAEDAMTIAIAPVFPLTVYFEGVPGKDVNGIGVSYSFDDGTANNQLLTFTGPNDNQWHTRVTAASSITADIAGGATDYTNIHKEIARYATNDSAFFVNGSQIGATDVSCAMPAGLATFRVGSLTAIAAGYAYGGGIQNLRVYGGLPDAQCIRLSSL